MIPNSHPPGTPDWWRFYLVHKLIERQARYDLLEDYHIGNHQLPPGDARYIKWLRKFQDMAKTNYITLVNNSPVGRMRVRGFQFGKDDAVDDEAKMIWAANDMDLQSKKMHSACAVFGDCYLLVGPVDEDSESEYPTMTVEDPRIAIVEPDPRFPSRGLAGLRMWEDVTINKIVTVLYLPDSIHTWHSPVYNNEVDKTAMSHRLMGAGIYIGMDFIGSEPNELGEVPLIHFSWNPDFTDQSFGEAENVIHIQDRINYMILDRIKIARDQAYQQRWAKAVIPAPQRGSDPKKGPQKPPFDPGSDTLWITDNPDAEFGNFDAVDFKQILEAVRDDIADMAAISQTPAHYLMNRMVNVSGDTLTQAESGFTSKIRLRMDSMGWGWERAMKVAFKYMGNSKATEVDANVLWANPAVRKDVDAADAASKWVSAGLPIELAMDEFGHWTYDQITYAAEKAEEKLQQEQEMAMQQMQVQVEAAKVNAGARQANQNQKTSAGKPAAKAKPAAKQSAKKN